MARIEKGNLVKRQKFCRENSPLFTVPVFYLPGFIFIPSNVSFSNFKVTYFISKVLGFLPGGWRQIFDKPYSLSGAKNIFSECPGTIARNKYLFSKATGKVTKWLCKFSKDQFRFFNEANIFSNGSTIFSKESYIHSKGSKTNSGGSYVTSIYQNIHFGTVERITNLIKKIRNAAKSAYGKDERNLKRFKCDERIPTSVAKLLTTCQYLSGLVLETHDLLLESGLVQADIDGLNSAYGDLTAVDAAQENAKKLQVAATLARDEAATKLADKMYRIRNFAKACFAGNAEAFAQFKAIPKGRGGGNGKCT